MLYDEYVEMFSKGMERITGECNPKLYESILTNNTLDASDIEKLINVLFISGYDVRRILELKEYLSARGAAEYACSFVNSIDLKENLNLFCIRNEVPEVARVYIIDKTIAPVNEIMKTLLNKPKEWRYGYV